MVGKFFNTSCVSNFTDLKLTIVKGLPGSQRTVTGFETFRPSTSPKIDQSLENAASDLEKVLYQNIATCLLKLNKPSDAINQCNNALRLDPKSWKAYLRKSQAFSALNDFNRATELLDTALSECGSEPGASSLIEKERVNIERVLKRYEAAEKKAFRGMFESSS